MHAFEAVDLSWGGNVSEELRAGADGARLPGLWSQEERAKTIAFRESRALRLVLESILGPRRVAEGNAKSDGLEELEKIAQEGCRGRLLEYHRDCSAAGSSSPVLGRQLCDRLHREGYGDGIERANSGVANARGLVGAPRPKAIFVLDREDKKPVREPPVAHLGWVGTPRFHSCRLR